MKDCRPIWRGWAKTLSKFFYGGLAHVRIGGIERPMLIDRFGEVKQPMMDYPFFVVGGFVVEEDTLGQHTGLFDYLETPVYEGDYIQVDYPEGEPKWYLVKWDDRKKQFYLEEKRHGIKQGKKLTVKSALDGRDWLVVGNDVETAADPWEEYWINKTEERE